MAMFSPTLFEVDDRVTITVGDFKGSVGKVVSWVRLSSDVPDTIHRVHLDKPVTMDVQKEMDIGGGKRVIETESVTIEIADVPASHLRE